MMVGLVGHMAVLSLIGAGHGSQHGHPGPTRVLRVARAAVHEASPPAHGVLAIEQAALHATGGGRIESLRPSVWMGKPVWMCTVAQGRIVWHVMVDPKTLSPVSKVVVPQR